MVSVRKVSIVELPELVELSYSGDNDLLEKFHTAKHNLITAKMSTMIMIDVMSKKRKLNYYKVIYQKRPIGYFVTGANDLYSFGINSKFRSQDILKEWWLSIKKVLGKRFLCQLYENNTRGIRFLQKMGMSVMSEEMEDDRKIICLINNN